MMKKYFFLLFFFSVFIQDIYSQSNTTHLNLNSKNIAVDGYDLVSYFEENKAVLGKKNFKYTFEGVNYYFASEKHLKRIAVLLRP